MLCLFPTSLSNVLFAVCHLPTRDFIFVQRVLTSRIACCQTARRHQVVRHLPLVPRNKTAVPEHEGTPLRSRTLIEPYCSRIEQQPAVLPHRERHWVQKARVWARLAVLRRGSRFALREPKRQELFVRIGSPGRTYCSQVALHACGRRAALFICRACFI